MSKFQKQTNAGFVMAIPKWLGIILKHVFSDKQVPNSHYPAMKRSSYIL